jgi:acyl-CoA reductase-like NAD-dependent aldehyde dehydrogenase
MRHVPILRKGRPYRSVDVARLPHHQTREPYVEVSLANGGLVRRDLRPEEQRAMRAPLEATPVRELIALSARAAELFATGVLPLGETRQSPEDYVRDTSATTGMPHVMVRRNLEKVRSVLANVGGVLDGLTRGLALEVLDAGLAEAGGRAMSFAPRCDALGVVLPSNSPGVHALWVPTIALKTALVLKPGSAEPWTPYRIAQAFFAAGLPSEAVGYYPADHAGAQAALLACGRGILFGDVGAAARFRNDPRIEVHGPGYSKVLLGPDKADDWELYLDVMARSILDNGGRSCINASGIWVTRHADAIAEALADRLARVGPLPAEDEAAEIAPFADPRVAERLSASIDEALLAGGARDVTAARRAGGRLARSFGCTYLLPTVVRCDGPDHPLANREFLFPFASVVEVSPDQLPQALGPTLALAAITEDRALVARLLASPLVQRLNLGALPTSVVAWDQPHEGNLFDHLYARRAVQRAAPA